MNTMEKIEKFVGPIAHPMWDGTCITRHEGDIVLLEHSGEVALRIKPDGLGEATIPPRVSKRWIEVVGQKFGIRGIYERRNIKYAQHREVRMHHCSFLIGPGEVPLTGRVKPIDDEISMYWQRVRFDFTTAPAPQKYVLDTKKSRAVVAEIRQQWNLHSLTRKLLGKQDSSQYAYGLKWDRKARVKRLLGMDYEGFLKVRSLYSTVEEAVASCNLELYQQAGCLSLEV